MNQVSGYWRTIFQQSGVSVESMQGRTVKVLVAVANGHVVLLPSFPSPLDFGGFDLSRFFGGPNSFFYVDSPDPDRPFVDSIDADYDVAPLSRTSSVQDGVLFQHTEFHYNTNEWGSNRTIIDFEMPLHGGSTVAHYRADDRFQGNDYGTGFGDYSDFQFNLQVRRL